MNWFERRIRRYEHRRWTTDDNRRVQPFHWGLEHIGGSPDDPNPGAFVRDYARKAIESSREWYAASPATDYRLDGGRSATAHEKENVLTFTSSVASPWPENNTVHAQLFPARKSGPGPAVLLLPNWNAKWHGQNGLCHWIQRMGITVLKMSMPYHDRRMARGHERADQICGPNIGSSVGYITLVHDERVRAGGFFHVSTYYADVISQGMTTNHVWEGLRNHVTVDELREYWSPISPMPYVERGMGAGRNTFMVYGKYDPTMLPELTRQMLDSLRRHGADPRTLELACGHYSLELAPFSYLAGYRMLTFFLESLA